MNVFALLSETFDNIIDFDGIPIEDSVGNKAQGTGFVHNQGIRRIDVTIHAKRFYMAKSRYD